MLCIYFTFSFKTKYENVLFSFLAKVSSKWVYKISLLGIKNIPYFTTIKLHVLVLFRPENFIFRTLDTNYRSQ